MKRKTKNRIIGISILALLAGLVCFCGAGSASSDGIWFKNSDIATWYNSWGKDKPADKKTEEEEKPEEQEKPVAVSSDGELMTGSRVYAMPKGISFFSDELTEGKPTEVSGGTVTIAASQSNAYMNGVFNWTAEWSEEGEGAKPSSPVSDYLDLTSYANGKSIAISYKSAFPRQIILTASLRGGSPAASDSCTVDCISRFVKGSDWDNEYELTQAYNFQSPGDGFGGGYRAWISGLAKTIGTYEGMELRVTGGNLQLTPKFVSDFKKLLKFDVSVSAQTDISFSAQFETSTYERDDGGTGYTGHADDLFELTYSTFINGFDNYDDAHKQAIYYAWHKAAQANYQNCTLTYSIFQMNGNVVFDSLFDEDVSNPIFISGENLGKNVQFNVTLNNDVVLQS